MIFMARSSHLGQVLLRERMPLPALFLDPDAAHESDKEIWKRGFKAACPWPPPEPSRWDGRRPPLSVAKVQVKASSKPIFDRFLLAIFKSVWEYTILALVR